MLIYIELLVSLERSEYLYRDEMFSSVAQKGEVQLYTHVETIVKFWIKKDGYGINIYCLKQLLGTLCCLFIL